MNVIHTAKDLQPCGHKVCLAIGVFDGVHLGHQQIIRQTVADAHQHGALAVVLTFDRHPSAIVAPQHVPPLIYSASQKMRAIELLGCNALLVLRFDREFSQLTGEQFIRQLADELGRIQSICVGADFVFGHRRSGNVSLLRELGAGLNFTVHGIAAVSLDGEVVSSTRIREAIRRGDFDAAGQMLGRPYSVAGPVVKGDQLGHQLGFPTANLALTGMVLPPDGVYWAYASIGDVRERAVLNIGRRPTIKDAAPQQRFEVHLLDFDGDLYGQEMEVTIGGKLRDEQKFASVEMLREQITRDVAEARGRF